MRRNRIILIILWIMSVVAISFYGGPVSYGFFIVLTAIPAVSLIYIITVILGFRIFQRLDGRNLISDRTSDFYFTLQNESPIRFAGIRAVFYSSFSTISGLDDAAEYELAPHKGIRKQTELLCRYRGEYEVGIKKIIVQDYLRLFSISYKNREPLRVKVKPNIVTLPHLHAADVCFDNARDARENMTEPDVLAREYVPGDDIRKIHWAATASSNRLMTRESIGQRQEGVAIVIDPKRCSDRQEEYLPVENKILETAIALVMFFVLKNIPCSIYCCESGITEHVVSDMGRFDDFYERISEYSFEEGREREVFFGELLRTGYASGKRQVFYVTYETGPDAMSFVGELIRSKTAVTVYVIGDGEMTGYDGGDGRCSIVAVSADADLTEVL